MAHAHVPNVLYHPLPGADLDPVGQRLSSLWMAIDNVREVDRKRLYGDSVKIAAGAIQLRSHAEDLRRAAKELDDAADDLTRLAREVIDRPLVAAE